MAAVAKRKIDKVTLLNKSSIDEGLRTTTLLRGLKFASIDQGHMYFIVASNQLAGKDMTIADVVKEMEMPFSTASRIAFDLVQNQLFRYENHATDRRKKIVRAIIP